MSIHATVPFVILAVSALLLLLGAVGDDRRARAKRFAMELVELPLIHSINDDRCIGCEACVDVCPTEVLELVDHKARVVRFSDCVQCEQCANSCPTTALVMHREGSAPQTLTVPELDENFQTGVPGQYLIGEVAGKPLVKNAANLGRAVIENIVRELANVRRGGDVLDVAIVGSGPGGLSAGLTCLVRKLSCVVLEKEHMLASTVGRYPKGKLFMAEPAESGNLSYLPVFDATKEDLVAMWQKVVAGTKLPVKLGEAVESVKRGDDGIFTIKTTVATYRAHTVVLATGLRGKPRLLAVPGANLEKVQSRLEDPDLFGGHHVLVVGGGDSAVESAMSLVDAGATVTLSYRGDGFKRCKQGNQKRLAEMTAAGKLPVLLESNVTEFTATAVSIKLKDGSTSTIPNQQAFVLIGADTPVAWLEGVGVRFIEREHLYALGSTQDVVRRFAPDAAECPKTPDAAIAIVLGKPAARPSRPATRSDRNEHSIVRRIKDEFGEMVTELTGVFKIADIDKSKVTKNVVRRAQTSSTLIPPEHLTRKTPVPKLFAQHDRDQPYTPAGTTIEMMSLPALLKARAQKTGRTGSLPVTPAQSPMRPQPRPATTRDVPSYRTGVIEALPVPPAETTVETHALPRTIVDRTLVEITNVDDSVPLDVTVVETPKKTAPPERSAKRAGEYGPQRPKASLGLESFPVVRPPPIPPPIPPPRRDPRVAKGSEPPPYTPDRVLRKRGSSR